MDVWQIALFLIGAFFGSVMWHKATEQARTPQQAMTLSIGWFALLSLIYFGLLSCWMAGFDLWGQLRYVTAFFMGMFIRIPLPRRRAARETQG